MSEHVRLELLAPAANLTSGKIAVDYGADALYIGGPAFGARAAAGNTVADIARLVDYARPFGVRVYAALNTLIFDAELAYAEKTARDLISAGVDALIVQDMAFMRMGLKGVEFHASTQTCNVDPQYVWFLGETGFSRVILERGLTFDEIRRIRAATEVELECFVHGAICVGFSGRCYLSRSMGPRSGNRGDCMQACRLPYDLTDNDGRIVLRNKHLLSVTDLDLSSRLGELADAGITSFKIEGRLKDENYVKNVVSYYRQSLDRVIGERDGYVRSSSGRSHYDFTPDPAQSFSRAGSEWMFGGGRRGMASFDTPKATGAYAGTVVSVSDGSFRMRGVPLTAGDGICFMSNGELTGTYVNHAEGDTVRPEKISGIAKGVKIYRNFNKIFEDKLRKSLTYRNLAVDAVLTFANDEVVLRLTDEDGISVCESMATTAESAQNPEKMKETLRVQIAKSGGTIFDVRNVRVDAAEVPFMPVSAINELRRKALDRLLAARMAMPRRLHIAAEDPAFPYPARSLGGEANVANALADRFYRDHGAEKIDKAFDLRESIKDECVMTSAYCIRREIGQCLKENPHLKGNLYLRRGALTYLLEFDCAACRMRLIYK